MCKIDFNSLEAFKKFLISEPILSNKICLPILRHEGKSLVLIIIGFSKNIFK